MNFRYKISTFKNETGTQSSDCSSWAVVCVAFLVISPITRPMDCVKVEIEKLSFRIGMVTGGKFIR